MAEITNKRQGEIQQAVLKVLKDAGEELPAREVIRRVEHELPPTKFESADYPSRPGVRRFDKVVRFNTIGPVKAGWLIKAQGKWAVTEAGLQAVTAFPDPEALHKESGRLYREWKKTRPEDVDVEGSPEESHPSVTLEEAEETARQEIRDYLAIIPPYDLQELVAALLRAMGYHVAWVAPPGPDKGIDIVAFTDPLGASGPRIKAQVKRRADKISVQEVRSFIAVLGPTDVGIFVANGGFTPESITEARLQESRRVSLLAVDDLLDLWVEYYERIPEASRALLPLRPIYYLAPS
ncbi:MAG: restriction endonuclease [Acidimicrobiales bacterium]